MPASTKIRSRHRKAAIGDMRWLIDIYDPIITPPDITNFIDYSITKTPVATVFAYVKTFPTEAIFDGANVELSVTHDFIIRYRSDITKENNIRYPATTGEFYDITYMEDLENRHEFLLMRCNKRGVENNDGT